MSDLSKSKKRILTIKEFDRLNIRQKRDLDKNTISEEDAFYMQSTVVDKSPVFSMGNRCLIAQQWVGVIELPDYTIEILPKLYGHVTTEELRDILIRMLLISRQNASIKQFKGSVTTKKDSVAEMLIYTFLRELQEYVQSGLQYSYRRVEKNLDKIKGRIVINQQLNKNILIPTRFYCRYSKYVDNNMLNQFFKTCLVMMRQVTRDYSNLQMIEELLLSFIDIDELDKEQAIKFEPEFNSINARAKEPYQYGKLFIHNLFATMSAGNTQIFTMLFDMNKLYELFIYRVSRIVFGNKITYQKRGDYMVSRNRDGKKFIGLRPDLTLRVNETEQWIIDTKWKLPQSFAKESDIYQMNAYSTGIRNVSKVILLYPKYTDKWHLVEYYTLLSNMKTPLEIRFIELEKCLHWDVFIKDFKEMFLAV